MSDEGKNSAAWSYLHVRVVRLIALVCEEAVVCTRCREILSVLFLWYAYAVVVFIAVGCSIGSINVLTFNFSIRRVRELRDATLEMPKRVPGNLQNKF